MAKPSNCRNCGAEIFWFHTASGKTGPPLVPQAHNAILVIDGIIRQGKGWDVHRCTEQARELYQRRLAADEEARQQYFAERRESRERAKREREELLAQRRSDYAHFIINAGTREAAREGLARAIYAAAMDRACPDCEAELGQPCENLAARRRGVVEYTKNPHTNRTALIPSHVHPVYISETEYAVPPREEEHGH